MKCADCKNYDYPKCAINGTKINPLLGAASCPYFKQRGQI